MSDEIITMMPAIVSSAVTVLMVFLLVVYKIDTVRGRALKWKRTSHHKPPRDCLLLLHTMEHGYVVGQCTGEDLFGTLEWDIDSYAVVSDAQPVRPTHWAVIPYGPPREE